MSAYLCGLSLGANTIWILGARWHFQVCFGFTSLAKHYFVCKKSCSANEIAAYEYYFEKLVYVHVHLIMPHID